MDITIETILSLFKNKQEKKRIKTIKEDLLKKLLDKEDSLFGANVDRVLIEKEIERVIKEDKSLNEESFLVYNNGYYKQRPSKRPVGEVAASFNTISSEYIGRAGELAVMSELIFRGYNANRMMIDEGVDIVAVKDNIYYYVQVKTTSVRNGRIYCQIGKDRFSQYVENQIRYFVVARFNEKGEERNMFFMFTHNDIERYGHKGSVKWGEDCISIKIGFDERTGKPFLYDGNKQDEISWHLNNFKL